MLLIIFTFTVAEDLGDSAIAADSGDIQERVEGKAENSPVSLKDSIRDNENMPRDFQFSAFVFSSCWNHRVALCTYLCAN